MPTDRLKNQQHFNYPQVTFTLKKKERKYRLYTEVQFLEPSEECKNSLAVQAQLSANFRGSLLKLSKPIQ